MRRGQRAVVAAAFALILVGCTLDWTVRPDPAAPVDASVADAHADVTNRPDADDDDTTTPDAGDSGVDAAVDCDALTADVAAKKKSAQACSFQPGECSDTVDDACGCEVSVAKASASATTAYSAAVTTLEAHPECLTCAACPAHIAGTCLQNAATTIACQP